MREIQGEKYFDDIKGIAPFRGRDAGQGFYTIESAPVEELDQMIMESFCSVCPLWSENVRLHQEAKTTQTVIASCSGWKKEDSGKMWAALLLSISAMNLPLEISGGKVQTAAVCKFNPEKHTL